MLIAAFLIASFFPPYNQPVVASQLAPGIVAGQCFAASSDTTPVVVPVACGGGGGGPTLAGNNVWTGVNAFTNTAGTQFGALNTPNANQPTQVLIAAGAGINGAGAGNFTTIGADSTVNCGGAFTANNGDALVLNNSISGPILTVDLNSTTTFCNSMNVIGPITTSGGLIASGNVLAQGVVDTLGGNATFLMGRTGAPSGACISGSIYTRSDGTTGASVYNCLSSAWVAAPSP